MTATRKEQPLSQYQALKRCLKLVFKKMWTAVVLSYFSSYTLLIYTKH